VISNNKKNINILSVPYYGTNKNDLIPLKIYLQSNMNVFGFDYDTRLKFYIKILCNINHLDINLNRK
jgi:hypothetical protein